MDVIAQKNPCFLISLQGLRRLIVLEQISSMPGAYLLGAGADSVAVSKYLYVFASDVTMNMMRKEDLLISFNLLPDANRWRKVMIV